MKKTNNKGFSLVELIIVIAIMAVLIGVLAPQFIKYVEKSKESKDITNLDSCVEAVKIYYSDKEEGVPEKVVISVDSTSKCFTGNDSGNKALTDAGAANSKVSGKWEASNMIQATVHLTDSDAGKVEYAGKATYYEADGDKGFKAVDSSSSTSGGGTTNP